MIDLWDEENLLYFARASFDSDSFDTEFILMAQSEFVEDGIWVENRRRY